jgi:hypothetical protein
MYHVLQISLSGSSSHLKFANLQSYFEAAQACPSGGFYNVCRAEDYIAPKFLQQLSIPLDFKDDGDILQIRMPGSGSVAGHWWLPPSCFMDDDATRDAGAPTVREWADAVFTTKSGGRVGIVFHSDEEFHQWTSRYADCEDAPSRLLICV